MKKCESCGQWMVDGRTPAGQTEWTCFNPFCQESPTRHQVIDIRRIPGVKRGGPGREHFEAQRAAVKDVIVHEEAALTVKQIAERLATRGIVVERRMVAFYRQQLGILPKFLR